MPVEIIELVKAGGAVVAPVFVYLWWYEREERRQYQSKNEQLAERTVTAMVEFKGLLHTIIEMFNGRKA